MCPESWGQWIGPPLLFIHLWEIVRYPLMELQIQILKGGCSVVCYIEKVKVLSWSATTWEVQRLSSLPGLLLNPNSPDIGCKVSRWAIPHTRAHTCLIFLIPFMGCDCLAPVPAVQLADALAIHQVFLAIASFSSFCSTLYEKCLAPKKREKILIGNFLFDCLVNDMCGWHCLLGFKVMCVTAGSYFDPRRDVYKPRDAMLLESFQQEPS